MTVRELRQKYLDFFKARGHVAIPQAKLVLEDDPTTLFTSAGMQPLIPYLLGKPHEAGKRLVNSQPCFRADDITEVGDNRHTTFFEMLGNWSLGDYFKTEQITWIFEFLTKEIGLDPNKLHVTLFEGNDFVPKDTESQKIWKKLGVEESHIHFYGDKKNWWSRSGTPDQMPKGEIGGTDSEVFYEFGQVEHDPKYGKKCHPNCDCGRFLEICNSVFIQYQKQGDGSFKQLPQKNVDFGGGLERLTAASSDDPDIFQTDLYLPIVKAVEETTGKKYEEESSAIRVIADHMKAVTFLIAEGLEPSNKLQGYVLRRLLRRAAVKMHLLMGGVRTINEFMNISKSVVGIYSDTYFEDKERILGTLRSVIASEVTKFANSLIKGMKEIGKIEKIDGKKAFDLFQSFGFPYEVTEELFKQRGQKIDKRAFDKEFKKHQELSRAS